MQEELIPEGPTARLRAYPMLLLLLALGLLAGLMLGVFFWRTGNSFESRETLRLADTARQLAEGHGFSTLLATPLELGLVPKLDPKPNLLDAPLFPAFTAVFFEPLLSGALSSRLASTIAFLLMLALLGWQATRCFGFRTAALAVVFVCLTPGLLSNAVSGRPEPLAALFLIGATLPLLYRARLVYQEEAPDWPLKPAALAGLLASLAALTLYPALVLVVPFFLLVRFAYPLRRLQALLAFSLAWLVPQLLWALRLLFVTGKPFFNPWCLTLGMYTRSRPSMTLSHLYVTSLGPLLRDFFYRAGEIFLKVWLGFISGLAAYSVVISVTLFAFVLLGLWLRREDRAAVALRWHLLEAGLALPLMLGLFVPEASYLAMLAPLGILFGVDTLLFLMDLLNGMVVHEGQYVFVLNRRRQGSGVLFRHHVLAIVGFALFGLVTCIPPLVHPFQARPLPKPLLQWASTLPSTAVLVTDQPERLAWECKRLCILLPASGDGLSALNDLTGGLTAIVLSPDMRRLPPHSFLENWRSVYLGVKAPPADMVPATEIDGFLILLPGERHKKPGPAPAPS